eukprot:GHRQ01000587.1.p1 GENE.GHRQ01000587.1~~GHRQ01000587.1.p1  ORF type:complete len:2327 (+),score=302.27 GHRQ01000587.1:5202-12182(+)
MPFTTLDLLPPPDNTAQSGSQRLKRLTKTDTETLRHTLATKHGQDWTDMLQKTARILQEDVRPHWHALERESADLPRTLQQIHEQQASEVVDTLGEEILNLLANARDAAYTVCPTIDPTKSWRHYRSRGLTCARKRLMKLKHAVSAGLCMHRQKAKASKNKDINMSALRDEAFKDHKAATMLLHSAQHRTEHSRNVTAPSPEALAAVQRLVQEHLEEHPEHTAVEAHQAVRDMTRAQLNELDKQCPRLAQQQAMLHTQQQLDSNQRKGNKQAIGKHKPNPKTALRIIKTSNGTYATTKDTVIPEVEGAATRKFTAPEPNGKQGKYLPDEAPRNYPFDSPSEDEFKQYQNLMQHTAPASQHRQWLHTAIDDELEFEHCLKGLANNKASGPDDVCNEVIKALPPAGHQALHNMMRIMWATGHTPHSWKRSTTLLLYKHKGTPLELKYYRWIGLELTVYKLWTRMVTRAMADRAERLGMLSSSQAGFRNKRSTADQVEMMVMALEDAHLFKQNIYMLQADLTEAFDTISHDKVLMILYDLQFPTDAIEVVKNLYTQTRTTVQTPYGMTKSIPIERGTIQGDSLSPFLFVLYMEPLLRWLRAGNKGYHAGALSHMDADVQQTHQIADITYADDINIITGGRSGLTNLKHQATKLSRYADWGHLSVSNTKTTVTGALHGDQPNQPYDEIAIAQRLHNTISIQGKKITYQSPKQPFRHLGVLLTMDLNYKPQLKATLEEVASMTRDLGKSLASAQQKQRIVEQSIRPSISYAFMAAPYTLAEIKCLDSLLTRAVKQAQRLPNGMSTAATHLSSHKGGLNCHSLEVEYNKTGVERLTRSLNNTGTLGVISNALYKHQCQGMDHLTAQELPYTLRYSMRVRQLMAFKRCDLRLYKAGQPLDTMKDRCSLATALEQAVEAHTQWDKRLVHDVHTLSSIGIQSIEQMLNTPRTMVCPASDLTRMLGARKIKNKHKIAWNKLSHLLTTGLNHRASDHITTQDMPLDKRHLHSSIREALQTLWPANPTAKPHTIMHMLAGLQHGNCTRIHKIRNKMTLNMEERMHLQDNAPIGINVRIAEAIIKQPDAKAHNTRSKATTGLELAQAKMKQLEAASGSDAVQLRQELLGLQDQYSLKPEVITSIDTGGFAKATISTPQGRSTQAQVLVKWDESVQFKYVLDIYKLFTYRTAAPPVRIQPDDPALSCIQWPCEICTQRNTATDSVTCKVCHRRYHTQCITGTKPEPEQHYKCRQCSTQRWTAKTLPPELWLYKATWKDTYEGEQVVMTAGTADAIAQLQSMTAPTRHQATAAVSGTPNPQPAAASARAMPPADTVYDITIGQARRRKLVVHTLPINPHADIEPTGAQEVVLRHVRCREGPEGAACCHKELACIYHADGRCEHMLDPATAAALHQRYQHMQSKHTKFMRRLKSTSFEQDVLKLVTRYAPGNRVPGHDSKTITDKQQCTLPSPLKDFLFYELGCKHERFASPLNVHAACTKYYSLFKEDRMFGAQGNAYSRKWTGPSIAVPDFDHDAAEQAVKWAVYSAKATSQKPTFTLLFLPSYSDSQEGYSGAPYMHWVHRHPECCRRLLVIPSSRMELQPPGNRPLAPDSKLKWNTIVLAVGNVQGFQQYLPFWEQEAWEKIKQRMRELFPNADAKGHPLQRLRWGDTNSGDGLVNRFVLPRDVNNITLPNKFRQLPNDCDQRPRVPTLDKLVTLAPGHPVPPGDADNQQRIADIYTFLGLSQAEQPLAQPGDSTRRAVQEAIATLRIPQVDIPPLKHNWRDFIYTDGSVLPKDQPTNGPGIGAAVHIPANPINGREPTTIPIDCSTPERSVDTINRAELAAISVAMDVAAQRLPVSNMLHIATDSLGSIRQVFKANTRPQDMLEHRHYALITHIANTVAAHAGTVHLWKVKSHIGIVGNEEADQAAGRVAKGEESRKHTHQFAHPSNNRDNVAWPHTEVLAASSDGEPQTRMVPLANMCETLASVAMTTGELGSSNVESVYFSSWKTMCPHMNHEFSHKFINNTTLPPRTRRLIHQARWGNLPTQKMFSRWDKTGKTNSLCLLCGREDGGHHAISGCKALSQTVTLRHNDAGAAIVKAIRKGSRGGELVASDIGVHKRSSTEELNHNGTMLTTRRKFVEADFDDPYLQNLPHRVQQALINQQSVPDALLYDDQYNTFTVVEIKYCRDTDTATQRAKATRQHQHLCANIIGPDNVQAELGDEQDTAMADLCAVISNSDQSRPSVHQITILLGVTGVIYSETEQQLTTLGVSGLALKKLLSDLHYTAISGLARIWKQRGALLTQLGHLKMANYSKSKKARMKRAFQVPCHRKHVKRRKA